MLIHIFEQKTSIPWQRQKIILNINILNMKYVSKCLQAFPAEASGLS